MLDKMKALFDMQKKMQEVKRQLDNSSFEISSRDGLVRLVMNGSQEVKEFVITDVAQKIDKAAVEKAAIEAYNMAIKHSHELAAQKMKEISGLDFPGAL